jgi:hypothetical protein
MIDIIGYLIHDTTEGTLARSDAWIHQCGKICNADTILTGASYL